MSSVQGESKFSRCQRLVAVAPKEVTAQSNENSWESLPFSVAWRSTAIWSNSCWLSNWERKQIFYHVQEQRAWPNRGKCRWHSCLHPYRMCISIFCKCILGQSPLIKRQNIGGITKRGQMSYVPESPWNDKAITKMRRFSLGNPRAIFQIQRINPTSQWGAYSLQIMKQKLYMSPLCVMNLFFCIFIKKIWHPE